MPNTFVIVFRGFLQYCQVCSLAESLGHCVMPVTCEVICTSGDSGLCTSSFVSVYSPCTIMILLISSLLHRLLHSSCPTTSLRLVPRRDILHLHHLLPNCLTYLVLPSVLHGFAVTTPSEAWQLHPQSIFSGYRLLTWVRQWVPPHLAQHLLITA